MKDDMTIIHGDCIEEMQKMPAGSVNLTVTSPPYDNLRSYEGSLQWGEHVWKPILRELHRVTADGGVVVWVVGDATVKGSETGTSFRQALHAMECGFNLHDTMIWQKPNPIPRSHRRYEQAFEYVFVFSKGSPAAWNPLRVASKHAGTVVARSHQESDGSVRHTSNICKAKKIAGNVWMISPAGGKSGHPARFPESLARDHVKSWSNAGDTVFDPFLGSGTTGIVAKELGRKFVGIEKVEEYYKLAKTRICVTSTEPQQTLSL